MKHYFKLDRKLSAQEKRPVCIPAKPWSAARCKRSEYEHKMWHGWWYYKLLLKYNNEHGFPMIQESLVGRKLREHIMQSTETI